MERTEDLLSHISSLNEVLVDGAPSSNMKSRNNPFHLKVLDQVSNLSSYEKLLYAIFDEYTDIHRFYPTYHRKLLTDSERSSFQQDLALFTAAIGGEITELRRSEAIAVAEGRSVVNSTTSAHREQVLCYLTERLNAFTHLAQQMQRRRVRAAATASPYLLFSRRSGETNQWDKRSSSGTGSADMTARGTNRIADAVSSMAADNDSSAAGGSSSNHTSANPTTTAATVTATAAKALTISNDFASRYEAEIASTSKLSEYRTLATTHRAALLSEAKDLTGQFREDLLEAHRVETSVQQVSTLLAEFSLVLAGQTGLVEEVHDSAIQASEQVLGAETELKLTVERSKSNSRNMTFLAVGLAMLLLLLDWLTP